MTFKKYYSPLDDTSELCYYIEYVGGENSALDMLTLREILGDLRDNSSLESSSTP